MTDKEKAEASTLVCEWMADDISQHELNELRTLSGTKLVNRIAQALTEARAEGLEEAASMTLQLANPLNPFNVGHYARVKVEQIRDRAAQVRKGEV